MTNSIWLLNQIFWSALAIIWYLMTICELNSFQWGTCSTHDSLLYIQCMEKKNRKIDTLSSFTIYNRHWRIFTRNRKDTSVCIYCFHCGWPNWMTHETCVINYLKRIRFFFSALFAFILLESNSADILFRVGIFKHPDCAIFTWDIM